MPDIDDTAFKVVMNQEQQQAIWPAERPNPPGWKDTGTTGTREACLRAVADTWTDLRPLSLRKKMSASGHP